MFISGNTYTKFNRVLLLLVVEQIQKNLIRKLYLNMGLILLITSYNKIFSNSFWVSSKIEGMSLSFSINE